MSFEMEMTQSCVFLGGEVVSDSGWCFWSEVIWDCLSVWLLDEEVYGYPDDADDVQQ